MKKQLEEFVKENRQDFDHFEPPADLWKKIEAKLPAEKGRTFSLGFVLRMAAILIMVMGVGFAFYLRKMSSEISIASINPKYAQQETRLVSLIETQRKEVKQYTAAYPDMQKDFTAEMSKMDSVYQKLKADLPTSPNRERVVRAMIRSLQIQTQVLSQQLEVIEQYNEYRKKEQHENKNI